MAKDKIKSVFFCQECGYESAKWMGQCPACRAWNSFAEETVSPQKSVKQVKGAGAGPKSRPAVLNEISMEEEHRLPTHIEELDRVLGGGIVSGSLTLVGGDPGIGKSTLLLQMCQKLSADQRKVLYISGEESLRQIKMRALRIGQFSDRSSSRPAPQIWPFSKTRIRSASRMELILCATMIFVADL